jgi:hypothetical protein
MMGIGQTMVQLGMGPITYPTGQPSESSKHIETGASLYVGLRRLTKLVCGKISSKKVKFIRFCLHLNVELL